MFWACVRRSSIVLCGPGQHTGTKWVWSAPSSVIVCTQNTSFPPHLIGRLHRRWVHNAFVAVQTTDARSGLQMPRLETDAERKGRVVSCAYAILSAGSNGPYLNMTVTTSVQIKSNLHLTKSLIFSLVFNQKITKIRACF